ncbi:Hypothetical_protein [Hexamita inflata]|uniref:Hypothetical_protein n=1 Tax=Hexamita inflata TaxID=28002 RepID=A0AA86NVS3_9EUKA|nr:Hypothetical protein HINF_LOCUS14419 [Hexamita inflata]
MVLKDIQDLFCRKYVFTLNQNTTLPCLQGRCYFAYKGVGQLAYKGVPSCKTPLQASDKYHAFQPHFDHKSFKFDIFQRYILDTFLLIREMKSVSPLQASKHLPYKQGYVVQVVFIAAFIEHELITTFSIGYNSLVLGKSLGFAVNQLLFDYFESLVDLRTYSRLKCLANDLELFMCYFNNKKYNQISSRSENDQFLYLFFKAYLSNINVQNRSLSAEYSCNKCDTYEKSRFFLKIKISKGYIVTSQSQYIRQSCVQPVYHKQLLVRIQC